MRSPIILAITLTLLLNVETAYTQIKQEKVRNVEIASLILDSQTLKPIGEAKIYDQKGQQIAVTNSSGYFKATLPQKGEGEIEFKFKIEKQGYSSFTQEEHWGDLSDKLHAIFYVGLKGDKSDNNEFSEMETEISDLSFESVTGNFKNVSDVIILEQKIEAAKRKNDNVFFEIDDSYYLVDEDGWLKLFTKKDKILITGGKVISADQINSVVKRKNITRMTTLASGVADFSINTDN